MFNSAELFSFNSVNFPRVMLGSLSIKQTTPLVAEIICSRGYDMMLGGVAHKRWYLRGVESFAFFSTNSPKLKKSSTIKGLKSSS